MDPIRIRTNCNIKPEHVMPESSVYLYREKGVRPTEVSRILGNICKKKNDETIARIDKYIDYNESILSLLRDQLKYLNNAIKELK